MNDLFEPIEDLKFQKLFDIDKSLYQESRFLRDIRYRYNKLGFLSVNQINAFKKTVNDLKDPKKREEYEHKKRIKKKKKESLRLTSKEKKMLGLE